MLVRAIFVLAALETAPCLANAGTYSRSATTIPIMCEARRCPSVVVVRSPDGAKEVRRTLTADSKDGVSIPTLEVRTPKGQWDLPIGDSEAPWVDVDVSWSLDSQFVALSGNINGYMNSMRVFHIEDAGPVEIDAARKSFEDMLRRFPPCRGRSSVDPDFCEKISQHENYINFAAVDWMDSHTLILMSEVPCESRWGGIMCQVMGYEVDASTGKIVDVMTAREFKKQWQHAMPFRFHIPEAPEWQN